MNITLISLASASLYVAASILQWSTLQQRPTLALTRHVALASLSALLLHAITLALLVAAPGKAFSLAGTLSFVMFSVSAALLLLSTRLPLHVLTPIVFPLSALSAVLTTRQETTITEHLPPELGLVAHIALSLAAYAFITLANLQAIVLYWQNHQLRHRPQSHALRRFPPLQTNERALFELLWLGVILLTLAIMTGSLYVDDLFAQHLAHKTILTLLSWLLYSLLLAGRYLWGWRGLVAARLTLTGGLILMLGFLGSKFVLEVLLTPSSS